MPEKAPSSKTLDSFGPIFDYHYSFLALAEAISPYKYPCTTLQRSPPTGSGKWGFCFYLYYFAGASGRDPVVCLGINQICRSRKCA